MIDIGIAGCGHMGTVHAYALQQLVQHELVAARVVATYDPDPVRAASAAKLHDGAVPVESLDELAAAADVIWNCTWTAGHRAVVDAAAARGAAVFCEKPLAPTYAECEALAAALRPLPHQVGLVLRRAPVFLAIRDLVTSGQYGRHLATVFRDDQYFPIQGLYASTWRSDRTKAGGGTLIEHSIHDVDLLRMWFGDPVSVAAHTACRFGHPGIEDLAQVTLAYADGSTASLTSVWHQVLSRESSRRVEVFCEDALLWTDDDFLGPLHVECSDGVDTVQSAPPEWCELFELPEALAKLLAQYAAPSKDFLDALARGERCPSQPDVDTALAAHRLVELAYRSAADGGVPQPVEGGAL